MSEFSQNGIISTLHDFGTRSTTEIEKDLLKFSKERKMELILPCLYSELEGNALPNIVEEIIDITTGSLVLFPASLTHYSIPFESEQERIVLAFDVRQK